MYGDYRKFNIEMERVCQGYRLWKRGMDAVTCVVESYKNKRSVYFAASNLLPSQSLLREENKEYHLLLLGADQGEIIHKDFGPFFVNLRGEGSFFKKFSGAALECYTHCLLVVLNKETEETETLLSGTMPFFKPVGREEPCESRQDCAAQDCQKQDCQSQDCQEIDRVEPEIKPLGFADFWREIFDGFDAARSIPVFCAERDETGATWCRVSQSSPLPRPLLPCRDFITRYSHYIIGRKEDVFYVGVPGRFLKKEQPCREEGCFSLWQPIRGGEKYFSSPVDMTEKLQEEIFGYWIGGIDRETGEILPL